MNAALCLEPEDIAQRKRYALAQGSGRVMAMMVTEVAIHWDCLWDLASQFFRTIISLGRRHFLHFKIHETSYFSPCVSLRVAVFILMVSLYRFWHT